MSLSSEHGTSSGGLNTEGNLSDFSFLFLVPQIPQIPTNLNLLGSGNSQMILMTQFFADYLSSITIFKFKFDKMLIAKGFVCVTECKKGDLSLTHQSRFWLYPSRFCLCCKAKRLFCD